MDVIDGVQTLWVEEEGGDSCLLDVYHPSLSAFTKQWRI